MGLQEAVVAEEFSCVLMALGEQSDVIGDDMKDHCE